MAQSPRQRRTVGRVMHEFKHGELERSQDGKGGKVKSRRQAVAIALSESGSSNRQSPSRNAKSEKRSERAEDQGRTAQQRREGKTKVGARGRPDSSPAMSRKTGRPEGARARNFTSGRGAKASRGARA